MPEHNSNLTPFSQELRKNMTKEERRLWHCFLKTLPVRFNRQKTIGNYIADFYCASAKLIIELDGSQHYSEFGKEYDAERDAYMQGAGIRVLRYSNLEINRYFDEVCEDILKHIEEING